MGLVQSIRNLAGKTVIVIIYSCLAITRNNEKFILSAGGWNNSAIPESELFSVKNERWTQIKYKVGEDNYKNALKKGRAQATVSTTFWGFRRQKLTFSHLTLLTLLVFWQNFGPARGELFLKKMFCKVQSGPYATGSFFGHYCFKM